MEGLLSLGPTPASLIKEARIRLHSRIGGNYERAGNRIYLIQTFVQVCTVVCPWTHIACTEASIGKIRNLSQQMLHKCHKSASKKETGFYTKEIHKF